MEEGKKIVAKLGELKYELQHDRKMTPLEDDGGKDIEGYNKELEQRGYPSWLNTEWLFSECYLYRCDIPPLSLLKHCLCDSISK